MYNPFSTLVRIYFYNDPHMGYGDAGTFKYVKVTPEDFTKEINTRDDGSTWSRHIANPELKERLKSLGWDYYGMGFDFATEEKYNEEVARLRAQLERLETI